MADIPDKRVEFNDGKYALLRLGPGRYAWQLYDDPPQLTFSNRDIAIFHEVEEMRANKQRLFDLYHNCIETMRGALGRYTGELFSDLEEQMQEHVAEFNALLKEK